MLSDCYINISSDPKPIQKRLKTIRFSICTRIADLKMKFECPLFVKENPVALLIIAYPVI